MGVPTRTAFCLALTRGACGGDEAKSGEAKSKLPPVDAKATKNAVEALTHASSDVRPKLAAAALAEVEEPRLPSSLHEGLETLTSVAPDQRSVLLAKTIAENIELLDKACDTDAAELMRTISSIAPEERHKLVWDTCKFERHGLMTAADAAGAEPGTTMLAHMVYVHLAAGGPVSDDEKSLITDVAKMK